MLPSEFTERTKVTPTSEEYAEVEHIYNSVQMNKDEFCKLWLENRDNKIIAELMDTIKKLENDCKALNKDLDDQMAENESLKVQYEGELQQMRDTHKSHMEEFAKKLIKSGEYDMPKDIYDAIEEEFGKEFIICSKWEQSIEFQEEEIDYMVKKLQTN